MAKSKNKTVFFCKQCGYESSKWLGQCPACHEWDSFVEEPVAKAVPGVVSGTVSANKKEQFRHCCLKLPQMMKTE